MIGRLRNGIPVIDRANSHNHIQDPMILEEALAKVAGVSEFMTVQVNMDRVVGVSEVVETEPGDDVFEAVRPGRRGPSRFVRGRSGTTTTSVVVILKRSQCGSYYVLISAWCGVLAEPEPWDPKATARSREFWSRHAFVV